MSGPHELYCLGVPRLVSPAGVDVRFKARKHLALLVYLAVEPRRHQRDLLVDLLWPTASPSAARQSLSTAVSVLRSKLDKDALIGEPGTLRLVPGRARLDLERLESGDVLGNELVLPLEVDGFLEGFEVPDAPEFGHWRDRQHARLLPAIKAALIRLADFARRTADVRRLSRSADRLLAIDDLAEEGIRARMEASALTGDRLTAIRVYDEWSDRLARELGATPPPLLEGMALRLRRRGWERPVTSPVPTVRTEQWRDRPFVGRKREYRVLYETWEGVAQGMPRHILIVGDSGVGKTTLADRLATAIGLEGATVSRVRCFELERGIPYAAIGGVLAHLLDRPGAAAANPETLAELGRIIPEVRHRYANLPVTPDTQGESARIRFAEAALDFLTVLMEEHPVVLIVDDFQLADEASLAVLHLLMRRIEHRPWMVIMASREELPEGAVHGARIRDGANYLGVTELELGPMPPEESGLLLDALIQQSTGRPTATERRALLAAAGGYPMALELMFRDWEEHGADSLAISLGAMTVDVATNLDHTYRRLAASLDRALDPTIRTVLHMAAVLDRRLNEFEMYGLIDVSMGQTLTALAEL
ncbi:MAG TPA: AAA family ATPase, partial [Gemmatimonadales bacterium]